MIVVFRKKRVVSFMLFFLLVIGVSGAGYKMFLSESTFMQGEGKTLVIDAGHDAKR